MNDDITKFTRSVDLGQPVCPVDVLSGWLYGIFTGHQERWSLEFWSNVLQLNKPVKAEGNVEVWLMSLMKMAHYSLHCVIRTAAVAIQESGFQLLEFLNMFPAQVTNGNVRFLFNDVNRRLTLLRVSSKLANEIHRSFVERYSLMLASSFKRNDWALELLRYGIFFNYIRYKAKMRT